MQQYRGRIAAVAVLVAIVQVGYVQGQVPSYGTLYDPFQVLNLNLEMDAGDWNAIRNDTAYTIVKPAYFWADGENKIVVSAKRKPNLANGDKIALKIDINEYFDNLRWHGVKKLSLENGYDADAVSEGFAWYLHRRAAADGPDGYKPPLASWVNVTVNGQLLGMYANVEQVDKTYLRNRDQWISGETWLYKKGDIGPAELKSGSGDSPIAETLNYKPFISGGPEPPLGYEAQMQSLIDMEQMLTVGAINAFTGNFDELLSKGKNFFFADYSPGAGGGQRLYIPWDLDAVLGGSTSTSIYTSKGKVSDYHKYITDIPVFRGQYNQIMLDLLDGPLAVGPCSDFLDELEASLMPSLIADPEGKAGSTPAEVASHFDSMKQWITDRHANVRQQVLDDMAPAAPAAPAPVPEPSTMALLAVVMIAGLRRRRRSTAA